jgi:hypothetical protein
MNRLQRRQFLRVAGAALAVAHQTGSATEPSHAGINKIKVGQVGVSHAHATKLSVYRASPEYEVVGIVEPDPQLRQLAESRAPYRDLPWMTLEQLLARKKDRHRDLAFCQVFGRIGHGASPLPTPFTV